VRLLLDTHVLLWWLADDPGLAAAAKSAIADPGTEVFVSAATIWEIGIKLALGKLEVPGDVVDACEAEGFRPLPISHRHAALAAALPRHHDDPFDRMLVAQARAEGLGLVSRNARLGPYGVTLHEA
jgi:PIN domain nuclease of toxin-antitoxin system